MNHVEKLLEDIKNKIKLENPVILDCFEIYFNNGHLTFFHKSRGRNFESVMSKNSFQPENFTDCLRQLLVRMTIEYNQFGYFKQSEPIMLGLQYTDKNGNKEFLKNKPKVHQLKTWPEYFLKVKSEDKTFEIRKNDRNYEVGDVLDLREFCPISGRYTGDSCSVLVKYILGGGSFGVDKEMIIMSIIKI